LAKTRFVQPCNTAVAALAKFVSALRGLLHQLHSGPGNSCRCRGLLCTKFAAAHLKLLIIGTQLLHIKKTDGQSNCNTTNLNQSSPEALDLGEVAVHFGPVQLRLSGCQLLSQAAQVRQAQLHTAQGQGAAAAAAASANT
jgi:hypothetical protein